jgi:large subunit ribosomal protein L1
MADEKTIITVKEALTNSKRRKFVESVDLTINLKDIDMSVPKNRIEDLISLPKGRGKPVKVCVFGSGEVAYKAKGVADLIIQPDEFEKLASDRKKLKKIADEHSFFIAEAPLMPTIGRLFGIVLGPRGKMPQPIPAGSDPRPLITSLKNTIKVRTKDRTTFHLPVGTKKMSPEDIAENIELVLKKITARLERGEQNIASVYLKTTMGSPIKLM